MRLASKEMGKRRGQQATDNREFLYTGPLAWWPIKGHRFRWTPKDGSPECVGEKVAQTVWTHRLLFYIALIVTLILIVSVFNIQFFVRGE